MYLLSHTEDSDRPYSLTDGYSSEYLALDNGEFVPISDASNFVSKDYLTEDALEQINEIEWNTSFNPSEFV